MILEYPETFSINNTYETKEYWINQKFIPSTLKDKLKKSNVLFVPEERNGDIGFHEEVPQFLEYLEELNDEKINANICMDEKNYQEFILHSNVIRFGEILIEYIILPIFSMYLYDYLKNKFFNQDDEKIEIILNIQRKNDENIKFEYRGSFKKFKSLIQDEKEFIKIIKGDDD